MAVELQAPGKHAKDARVFTRLSDRLEVWQVRTFCGAQLMLLWVGFGWRLLKTSQNRRACPYWVSCSDSNVLDSAVTAR